MHAQIVQPVITGHPAALVLPASLDLTEAEALHQSLQDRLQEGALLIDAGAVERVSTPCLQVLAAAAASAAHRDVAFRLIRATDALTAAVADLGLAAAIPMES